MNHQRLSGILADHRRIQNPFTVRRRLPLVWIIVIDVLIGALILFIFSLFYFLLPRDLNHRAQLLPVSSVSLSSWRQKFENQFTDGAIEITDHSYRSNHISVTIDKIQKDSLTCYVADIYIADLKCLKSAFYGETYGKGFAGTTDEIARNNNAILAINGDYCGNNAGPVVRNGILYREQYFKDVLVMYQDGSMQTFTARSFDIDRIKTQGAWQVWTFGPMLLDAGQPMEHFNSSVTANNPRTAIGYYEPGHYCFIVVDGRQPGYSNGCTLAELSRMFYELGCQVAFNLDGGQSSEMAFLGELTNNPYHGGRKTSDIVMIIDEEGGSIS